MVKELTQRVGFISALPGQVAQLVEQRTENPCVGGSIPPLTTSGGWSGTSSTVQASLFLTRDESSLRKSVAL